MSLPPLRPLHADDALSSAKLEQYARASSEDLMRSLLPGNPGSLKARPDGTVVDGHHRLKVLKDRGLNIDVLPREIVPREDLP